MLIKRQSCNRLTALSYHTSLSKEKINFFNILFNIIIIYKVKIRLKYIKINQSKD